MAFGPGTIETAAGRYAGEKTEADPFIDVALAYVLKLT